MDAIAARSTACRPEWVEEDNYFFALSRYQEPLLELYEQRPDFVWPETRRNEMLGFLRQGLKDFSISRAGVQLGPAAAERFLTT